MLESKESEKGQIIDQFLGQLDEPGRREFIAFTLRQRRPHLHRLFTTASRRAYLAGLKGYDKLLGDVARSIKQSTHEDEGVCHRAAELARTLSFEPSTKLEAETVRVAIAAAEAADQTAQDIASYYSATVDDAAAGMASARAVSVTTSAYIMDARGSASTGMFIATTTAMTMMEVIQNEQIKWLKKRLGDKGSAKRPDGGRGRGLLGTLFGSASIRGDRRESVLSYVRGETELAALQNAMAAEYNDVVTKYGGRASAELISAARQLSATASEIVKRHSDLGPVPDEAGPAYFRWHEAYLAYQEWVSAVVAAYEGMAAGATPSHERVAYLFAQQQHAQRQAQDEVVRLLKRLGLSAAELRELTRGT